MPNTRHGHEADTCFAPAARASREKLLAARSTFLAADLTATLLEAVPDLAMVLNAERQIIAVNHRLLEAVGVSDPERLLGKRPGEAAGCIHAGDGPGGCGTGPFCITCGAVNAVLEALELKTPVVRECRLLTRATGDGGALDLRVFATYILLDSTPMVVVALRDISAEKRREVLERVFFHDVLNTAGGIRSLVELLTEDDDSPELEAEYKRDLYLLSGQIIDEISAQRELLAAEQGELRLHVAEVAAPDVVRSVIAFYRNHSVAHNRFLVPGALTPCELRTDVMLLRRVLGNLVKNALEAVRQGETVTIEVEDRGDTAVFRVYNPGVMPEEVQKQIFQRSFSTKSGLGRGIGTYSVRLLTERYLLGQVGFTSRAPEGTVFTVTLPKRRPEPLGTA